MKTLIKIEFKEGDDPKTVAEEYGMEFCGYSTDNRLGFYLCRGLEHAERLPYKTEIIGNVRR